MRAEPQRHFSKAKHTQLILTNAVNDDLAVQNARGRHGRNSVDGMGLTDVRGIVRQAASGEQKPQKRHWLCGNKAQSPMNCPTTIAHDAQKATQ